ncbi:hypothetical protein Tco_1398355, partial [Tanacetum coccineum]
KASSPTLWEEFAFFYNEYNKTNMTDLREGEKLRVFSGEDCREYAHNLEVIAGLPPRSYSSSSTMKIHNTRKRSQQGERSQTSSNFADLKRRRLIDPKKGEDFKIMNDNEWQLHDRALLTMFGDVRHGDDTSLNITVEDIALRVVRFREIFQSNPDPNPIQVPKNLLPISNGRSWLSTSGCNASSQSVGQAPTVASPTQDRTIKEAESIVADVTTCYLAELEGANQKEAESIVADVGKFFQTTES